MSNTTQNVALNTLDPGQDAHIVASNTTSVSPTYLRLLELGLTPGTPIKIIRKSPSQGPLEVELRGYRLSLRHSDAAGLRVTIYMEDPA